MEMRRAAVLVGCLYQSTPHQLYGCINDVLYMKSLLIGRFDFQEQNIKVLTDGMSPTPTRENIMNALDEMIHYARPGDVLFFFFSGHGIYHDNQQAIVPLDGLDGSNLITSQDFRTLVKKVPSGATLTIVADSGRSGRLIKGEPPQNDTPSSKLRPQNVLETPPMSKSISLSSSKSPSTIPSPIMGAIETESDGGILLSGCQPDETAFDVVQPPPHGAFTGAMKEVFGEHPEPITNKELVTYALEMLKDQNPGLYCSDGKVDAIFLSQQSESEQH